jgi:hypothetical protein
MKVEMLITLTGTTDYGDGPVSWPQRGEVADLPAWVAGDLIAAGYARTPGKVESATVADDRESAALPPVKGRKTSTTR